MLTRLFTRAAAPTYVPYRSGPGWTDEELLYAIRLWAQQTGAPPRWVDWTPSRARARGLTLRPGVAEGLWPTGRMIAGRFGGWNQGLERAGVKPRPAHRPKSTSKEQ